MRRSARLAQVCASSATTVLRSLRLEQRVEESTAWVHRAGRREEVSASPSSARNAVTVYTGTRAGWSSGALASDERGVMAVVHTYANGVQEMGEVAYGVGSGSDTTGTEYTPRSFRSSSGISSCSIGASLAERMQVIELDSDGDADTGGPPNSPMGASDGGGPPVAAIAANMSTEALDELLAGMEGAEADME